ncbi:hypothetical protein [Flavobacterium proteolyticum]|uniref:Uncharacterized protein n=1 Tax=Flavobacterium proteolyticum TaxID=2911683 RepID=A0ABR9WTK7_9FLAO|nr:hypothetical protein [Flavobacterium proteolyticum]MBE9576981.1 hypothetical protein [Flavobacterium proteolyticum]
MSENMKEIKKRATEEWLSSIPQLSAFAQNKLYRVVGCFIIGVELVKLPKLEEYRPHFVLYPLWKSGLKNCLDNPTILFEINNKKGLQFSIPYLKQSVNFNEVIECLKIQAPILLTENVSIKSLLELVDGRFNDILVKSNSAQQAKLFELKFYLALYSGNQLQIQNVLNQIQQASKNWNMQMFEMWYGKFDLWLQRLREKEGKREDFIKQIEANKQDKKIMLLKSSELTI